MPKSMQPTPDGLPPGPLRDLTLALNELHRQAGLPPARSVSRWIREDDQCPATVSHTTVGGMLRGTGLAKWQKLESVVRVLAQHTVRRLAVDRQVESFHALWLKVHSAEPEAVSGPAPGSVPGSGDFGQRRTATPGKTVAGVPHSARAAWELPSGTPVHDAHGNEAKAVPARARRTLEPGMAGQLCLPVYVIVDAPSVTAAQETLLNQALVELHDELTATPRLSDIAHVCVIAFAARPYVVVELTHLGNLLMMPRLSYAGRTDYVASFELLDQRMKADFSDLAARGWAVRRPLVLIFSSSAPEDDRWRIPYERLIDRRNRMNPHIIGYGFNESAAAFTTQVATLAAFSAESFGPDEVLDKQLVRALESLVTSVITSHGARQFSVEPPRRPGFEIVIDDV